MYLILNIEMKSEIFKKFKISENNTKLAKIIYIILRNLQFLPLKNSRIKLKTI